MDCMSGLPFPPLGCSDVKGGTSSTRWDEGRDEAPRQSL